MCWYYMENVGGWCGRNRGRLRVAFGVTRTGVFILESRMSACADRCWSQVAFRIDFFIDSSVGRESHTEHRAQTNIKDKKFFRSSGWRCNASSTMCGCLLSLGNNCQVCFDCCAGTSVWPTLRCQTRSPLAPKELNSIPCHRMVSSQVIIQCFNGIYVQLNVYCEYGGLCNVHVCAAQNLLCY